ncbi:OLC1v1018983C1 [Oldenlandia corymbosa var. corymbosa]|uniref:OLC1v1018983C1 n=1 Tax=Oldenlandia corymbosa var. corymbosa TaxID=529605 RepID=A0AAV1EDB7_OLDCO|nr:OLC1v1018983C1 [Oldenlandia corymbosa var. corymbosa]
MNDPNLISTPIQRQSNPENASPEKVDVLYPSAECAGEKLESSNNDVVNKGSSAKTQANQGSNCTLYSIKNLTQFPIRFHDAYDGKDYFVHRGTDESPEVWLPLENETHSSFHLLFQDGSSRQFLTIYGRSDDEQHITIADDTKSATFPTHTSVPFVSSKGCLTIFSTAHPNYRIDCFRHNPVIPDDLVNVFYTTCPDT